ncbi:hypothetical protein V8C43DRAFT_299193 [Trichoderma afarasin]
MAGLLPTGKDNNPAPARRPTPKRSTNHFQKQLSPDDYANAVKAYSKLRQGSNYIHLGNFLNEDRPVTLKVVDSNDTGTKIPTDQQDGDIVSMYVLESRDQATTPYDFQTPKEVSESQSDKSSCIIFLRGVLSAAWINSVGGRYLVDPAFFVNHLDLGSAQHDPAINFSIPSLPSSSWNLIQLPVTTIGIREHSPLGTLQSAWIEDARREGKTELDKFHQRLSKLSDSEVSLGESIIRNYYVFDNAHFAIDQRISICMQHDSEDEKKTFRLFVWIDAGTRSSRGFTYPWDVEDLESRLHPVVDYRPMVALKSHLFQSSDSINMGVPSRQDSLSQLSNDYGRSLHRETKAVDPFYALTEVFQFSANSQQQFLNMIDTKIRIYTSQASQKDHEILPHLKYTQEILYSRIQDIKRVLRSIENTARPVWAKSNCDTGMKKADIAAAAIRRDFEDLLDHAMSLYDRTKEAITVLQSSISITESHLASLQADKAQKLTFLALVFVPVSVATGIFGMNVKELPGDQISIYWFFVLVATLAILLWLLFFINWKWMKPGSRR